MVSAASNVRQLLIQPDGKILFLASIYEQSVRRRTEFSHVTLGRLMPNGAWDPGFALVEIELSLLNSAGPFWFNAPQRGIRIPILAGSPVPTVTMALQPDGTLVLAGAFDSVAGQPMHRLARLNADGTLRSGPMQLGLSLGNTPRLHLPKEIEAPYIIETSNDLRIWNPWRTNSTPWLGFDEVIEPGAAGATSTFLRARQID
ncbi:MAG: delta-60 repeat domain-containing protein [Verrucomicrobiota bacterium]